MTSKPASLLSAVLLGFIALAHLLRLLFRLEITAAGFAVPMWASAIAFLVPGALAIALWRESRKA